MESRISAEKMIKIALKRFGHALKKNAEEIEHALKERKPYDLLREYFTMFKDSELPLTVLLQKEFGLIKELDTEEGVFEQLVLRYTGLFVAKSISNKKKFGDKKLTLEQLEKIFHPLSDELSEQCLYGLTVHLPTLPENTVDDLFKKNSLTRQVSYPAIYKDDLVLNIKTNDNNSVIPHELNKEFVISIPEKIEHCLTNENIDPAEIGEFVLSLCALIRKLITFKNQSLQEVDPQNATDQINAIEAYIKGIKELINHMTLIFKERVNKAGKNEATKQKEIYQHCIQAIGDGINESFNRYIRSLARKTFGLGLQDHEDTAHDKAERFKSLMNPDETLLFFEKYKDSTDLTFKEILDKLDNELTRLETRLNNEINLEMLTYLKRGQSSPSITNILKKNPEAFYFSELWKLRNKIENELITFHTKGSSHTGEFGIKNVLLNESTYVRASDSEEDISSKKEISDDGKFTYSANSQKKKAQTKENIQFTKERAYRQLKEPFQEIAQFQHNFFDKMQNRNIFPEKISRKFKQAWHRHQDTTPQTSTETLNKYAKKLDQKNIKIIKSESDTDTLNFTIQYMQKVYERLTGNLAISDDSSYENEVKFFKSALDGYRFMLKLHPQAAKFLGKTNPSSNENLVTLHVKVKNVSMYRNAVSQLDSIEMNVRDLLLPKSEDNNSISESIKIILKNLSNSQNITDHLKALIKLQDLYTFLCDKKFSVKHRNLIEKIMIKIIKIHFLAANEKIRFPVKKKDLIAARSLISCIKTKGNTKRIENVTDLINQKIYQLNNTSVKFDNLLLAGHDEQNSKFKDLLNTQNVKSQYAQRVQRFGKALAQQLTNAAIANCALASEKIQSTLSKTASAFGTVNNAARALIPVLPSGEGVIKTLDQKNAVNKGQTFSANVENPVDWMNYVWKELTPALMEIFEKVVEKMEGEDDPERFAAFCLTRIMAKLESLTEPLPLENRKEERIIYIVKAILQNNYMSVLPKLPSYVRMNGDQSLLFLDHSFDKLHVNCLITTLEGGTQVANEDKNQPNTMEKEKQPRHKSWAYKKNGVPKISYGTLYFRHPGTAKIIADACGYDKCKENEPKKALTQ